MNKEKAAAAANIKKPEDAIAKKPAEFKDNQRKVYELYNLFGIYARCQANFTDTFCDIQRADSYYVREAIGDDFDTKKEHPRKIEWEET